MEVGEREGGICDQYFYHGECRCCFHRAPLPVVALLRGAPHEATAKGARVLTHGGRHGIRCPTRALFTSTSGGIIMHCGQYPHASLGSPQARPLVERREVVEGEPRLSGARGPW